MAGTPSPEDTITALVTVLTADLPAKLDSLDTEYTDALALDDISKFWLNYQEADRYDETPALVIVSTRSEITFRTYRIYDHVITIHIIMIGNDVVGSYSPQETLTLRLYRTARAIVETLETKPKLTISGSDYCDRIVVESIDYSDTFTDGEEFRRDGLITCLARTSTP